MSWNSEEFGAENYFLPDNPCNVNYGYHQPQFSRQFENEQISSSNSYNRQRNFFPNSEHFQGYGDHQERYGTRNFSKRGRDESEEIQEKIYKKPRYQAPVQSDIQFVVPEEKNRAFTNIPITDIQNDQDKRFLAPMPSQKRFLDLNRTHFQQTYECPIRRPQSSYKKPQQVQRRQSFQRLSTPMQENFVRKAYTDLRNKIAQQTSVNIDVQQRTSMKALPEFKARQSLTIKSVQSPPNINFESTIVAESFQSKSNRTKIFSGNRVHQTTVASLKNSCIRYLQLNLKTLTSLNFVPFDVIQPVLKFASPEDLLFLEYRNNYLLDDNDSDIFWEKHCARKLPTRKRLKDETWREMFARCKLEDRKLLRRITEKISEKKNIAIDEKPKSQLIYLGPQTKQSSSRSKLRQGQSASSLIEPGSSRSTATVDLTSKVKVKKAIAPNIEKSVFDSITESKKRLATKLTEDTQKNCIKASKKKVSGPMMVKLYRKLL